MNNRITLQSRCHSKASYRTKAKVRLFLENVDNFKMSPYYIIMKFKVEKLPQVEAEIEGGLIWIMFM